jgi:hypothetical protein
MPVHCKSPLPPFVKGGISGLGNAPPFEKGGLGGFRNPMHNCICKPIIHD